MDIDTFFETCMANNLVWLYSEKGDAPLNPVTLPSTVLSLANDPYRSLAEMAEDKGCFLNEGVTAGGTPFCQFQWANLFRDSNLLSPSLDVLVKANSSGPVKTFTWCDANPWDSSCFDEASALATALPKAMTMCSLDAAKDLCGFGKGVIDPPKCGN